MKRGFGGKEVALCFIFLFILFSFSFIIKASCSIGATPLEEQANVKPGNIVEIDWDIYNIDGDRPTHVTINKFSGPDWNITYDPPLAVAYYNVSGVIVNKTENLEVENIGIVPTIPENSSDGWSYVKHPTEAGYIPVKKVKIYVTVPDNTKLFQNYNFTFQAKGDCFMNAGSVIPSIATQLKVSITPINAYSEAPVSQNVATGGTGTGFSILGMGTVTSILAIIGGVLLLAFFYWLGRRGSRKPKENKEAGSSEQISAKPRDDKGMSVGFSSG